MYNQTIVLVTSDNQLAEEVATALDPMDGWNFQLTSPEVFFQRKKTFLDRMFIPLVLMDLEGQQNFTSTILAECKKRMPAARVVVLCKKPAIDHVHKSFLFGVSGYLVGKDRTARLASLLQSFLKTGYPPVSKEVVPMLIHAIQGQTDGRVDFTSLSEFQKNVARSLAAGLSYQEIADALQTNLDNVRYHVKQVYRKLNITKRIQLVPMV